MIKVILTFHSQDIKEKFQEKPNFLQVSSFSSSILSFSLSLSLVFKTLTLTPLIAKQNMFFMHDSTLPIFLISPSHHFNRFLSPLFFFLSLLLFLESSISFKEEWELDSRTDNHFTLYFILIFIFLYFSPTIYILARPSRNLISLNFNPRKKYMLGDFMWNFNLIQRSGRELCLITWNLAVLKL